MPIAVTDRALEVLRRALEAGKLDPERVGIRVWSARGLKGEETRTGFVEGPEPGDETLVVGGIRIHVPGPIAARHSTIDVSAEHDRIVLA